MSCLSSYCEDGYMCPACLVCSEDGYLRPVCLVIVRTDKCVLLV